MFKSYAVNRPGEQTKAIGKHSVGNLTQALKNQIASQACAPGGVILECDAGCRHLWVHAKPAITNGERDRLLLHLETTIHEPGPPPPVRVRLTFQDDPLLPARIEDRQLAKQVTDAEIEALRKRLGAVKIERL